VNAVRLAVSWFAVAPVRGPAAADPRIAGRPIALTPLVGAVLGAVAAGVVLALG